MSDNNTTPEVLVQRQLDAYNSKNLAAWGATYAHDAIQYGYPAKVLAEGRTAIIERAKSRFQEPDLHAKLLSRSVMGNIVIDYEDVTRNLPDGIAHVELVCIYCVEKGLIQSASFIIKPPVYIKK